MKDERQLHLTLQARDDIAELLDTSAERFGSTTRRRYEALVACALEDIRADPLRPGSVVRPELGEGSRTYHFRFSRDRTPVESGRVRSPRHLLVYELPDPSRVLVLRVLHDAMDLEQHVPE